MLIVHTEPQTTTRQPHEITVHDQLDSVEQAIESHRDSGIVIASTVPRAREQGEPDPALPLAGMTLVLKDNIDLAGTVTSHGAKLAGALPALRSAPVVAALEAAGARVVAKVNLHQFAYGASSENPAWGDVTNPRHPGFTPGGSSGGTAAALAARIADIGLGTDTSGSVRMPAACCGVVGLRPRNGVLSLAGVGALCPSFDTVGPMARTVADTALVWEALLTGAGISAHPGAQVPGGTHCGPSEPTPTELRPSLARSADPVPAALPLSRVVLGALDHTDPLTFRALGAEVRPFRLDFDAVEAQLWPAFRAEAGRSLDWVFPGRADEIDPNVRAKLGRAQQESRAAWSAGLAGLAQQRRELLARMDAEGIDVLVSRTLGDGLPLSAFGEASFRDGLGATVAAFSGLNLAALAIGDLQIVGRTEADVLAVGLAVERSGAPIPEPPLQSAG